MNPKFMQLDDMSITKLESFIQICQGLTLLDSISLFSEVIDYQELNKLLIYALTVQELKIEQN